MSDKNYVVGHYSTHPSKEEIDVVAEKAIRSTTELFNYIQELNVNGVYKLTRFMQTETLQEIHKVLSHGAKKYSPEGWKEFAPPNGTSPKAWYISKAEGHIKKYLYNDSSYEKESGCHHLAHAIANLMFVHWHDVNKTRST